jgi:hypothetical protein
MDQQNPDRAVGAASATARAEWTAPEVDRLIAGGAEGSDGADTDGADLLS